MTGLSLLLLPMGKLTLRFTHLAHGFRSAWGVGLRFQSLYCDAIVAVWLPYHMGIETSEENQTTAKYLMADIGHWEAVYY